MKSETVVLLTGGSSGIGQCTARYLAEAGCRVYELSRRSVCDMMIFFVRRNMRRHEPDLIQPILPVSLFSKEQVSVMDRVKCSPKNTNASHRILHY